MTTIERALTTSHYEGELQLYVPEVTYGYDRVYPEQAAMQVVEALEKYPYQSLLPIVYGGKNGSPIITPENELFVPVTSIPKITDRLVLEDFESHPSDFDDMKPGLMIMLGLVKGSEITENLATFGELGWDGHAKQDTKDRRIEEVQDAQLIIPRKIEYLKQPNGGDFPDGKLLLYRKALRESIKARIKNRRPTIITLHNKDYIDHPDHIAVGEETLAALVELSREPGYRIPAVYMSDGEYGYESGNQWVFDQYNIQNGRTRRNKRHPVVYPTLANPDFIVNTSDYRIKRLQALYMHSTQIMEPGKDYGIRIPALARIRGGQTGNLWGEALYQVKIPGVTAFENRLAAYLPAGTMFERKIRRRR